MVKALNLPEIQVRYVLPVIRKELAKALIAQGMSAKDAAKTLDITPAAVSQYMNEKRASEISLPKQLLHDLQEAALQLKEGKKTVLETTMGLLHHEAMMKVVCTYHKKQDSTLPHNCTICIRE
jgi:predicted transcriptional regulator